MTKEDVEYLKQIGDLLYMLEGEVMATRDGKPPSPKHVLEDLRFQCVTARTRLAYMTEVLP